MRQKFWLLSTPVFLAACTGLFAVFYGVAKERAVQALNEQQSLHAPQAAHGIEEFFAGWTGVHGSLARMEVVVELGAEGRNYLELFQERLERHIEENGSEAGFVIDHDDFLLLQNEGLLNYYRYHSCW